MHCHLAAGIEYQSDPAALLNHHHSDLVSDFLRVFCSLSLGAHFFAACCSFVVLLTGMSFIWSAVGAVLALELILLSAFG